MKTPEVPDDEVARLKSLRELRVLDTEAEERFDRITRLAKNHFNVPIALVSIVDANRQWFKSRQGLDAAETSRDISFCGHAILSDQTLVVPDASAHPDFADNPLVSNDPNIRFYAGAPLHAPGGARVGTLCIIDKQPRKLSDQELRVLRDLANCVEMELALTAITEHEHFLREITDAMPGLVAYWDKELICRFANRPYVEWFGRTPEQVIGNSIQQLLGDGLFKLNEPYIRGALAGKAQRFERTLTKADGTVGYTWAHYIPDARGGAVHGFFVLVSDITPLKLAENKIRAAEEHLAAILNNIDEGIVTFDATGIITSATRALVAMFGYRTEELIGRNIGTLIPEIAIEPGDGSAADGEASIRREFTARTKGGQSFPVEVALREMASGDKRLFVGVIRDITERVRSFQDLQKAKHNAEDANRAKDRFLATVSHEIRTPITAVLGMADLLGASELNPEQKGWLRQLRKSTTTLLELMNDILDFSKIAAGKAELEDVHFSLPDLVRDTCALFGPLASERQNTIGIEIAPLPGVAYRGDAKKYRQVLMNLLSNANKFTKDGRISVVVRAESMGCGRSLIETRVVDTGIGIAPKSQQRLFDAFTQEDASTSRKYGGTGLGLSISKGLVELMGGRIGVESIQGRGSTFSFSVPFEPGDPSKIEKQPEVGVLAPTKGALPKRGARVLLAEDDVAVSALVKTVLAKNGFTVTAVGDGAAAVGAANGGDYDIILMDMQMPIMDGPQAMRSIRAGKLPLSNVPIIALTADALRENHQTYLDAGANTVLTKPIAWPELLSEMGKLTR